MRVEQLSTWFGEFSVRGSRGVEMAKALKRKQPRVGMPPVFLEVSKLSLRQKGSSAPDLKMLGDDLFRNGLLCPS